LEFPDDMFYFSAKLKSMMSLCVYVYFDMYVNRHTPLLVSSSNPTRIQVLSAGFILFFSLTSGTIGYFDYVSAVEVRL
jgi:hypothetical protein